MSGLTHYVTRGYSTRVYLRPYHCTSIDVPRRTWSRIIRYLPPLATMATAGEVTFLNNSEPHRYLGTSIFAFAATPSLRRFPVAPAAIAAPSEPRILERKSRYEKLPSRRFLVWPCWTRSSRRSTGETSWSSSSSPYVLAAMRLTRS